MSAAPNWLSSANAIAFSMRPGMSELAANDAASGSSAIFVGGTISKGASRPVVNRKRLPWLPVVANSVSSRSIAYNRFDIRVVASCISILGERSNRMIVIRSLAPMPPIHAVDKGLLNARITPATAAIRITMMSQYRSFATPALSRFALRKNCIAAQGTIICLR